MKVSLVNNVIFKIILKPLYKTLKPKLSNLNLAVAGLVRHGTPRYDCIASERSQN